MPGCGGGLRCCTAPEIYSHTRYAPKWGMVSSAERRRKVACLLPLADSVPGGGLTQGQASHTNSDSGSSCVYSC